MSSGFRTNSVLLLSCFRFRALSVLPIGSYAYQANPKSFSLRRHPAWLAAGLLLDLRKGHSVAAPLSTPLVKSP